MQHWMNANLSISGRIDCIYMPRFLESSVVKLMWTCFLMIKEIKYQAKDMLH